MLISTLLLPAYQVNGKKYKVLAKIGEGGFAFVYRVKCVQGGAQFALKKMICQTPEQLAEAKKEIDLLVKIKHPHVMGLVDFSYSTNKQHQQEVCLVLPLYHTSVQHIIDQGPGYPYCGFNDGLDVVKVLRHCAEGLLAVHEQGFRHADLKPANILVGVDYHAVLTDFGSAQPLIQKVESRADSLTIQDTAATFTTASYRAPELFDPCVGMVIDDKADIWSFGCVMYAMIFSRTPFERPIEGLSTLSVMSGAYPIPDEQLWPADYLELIAQCLRVSLDQRVAMKDLPQLLRRLTSPPLDLKKPEVSLPISPLTTASTVSMVSPVPATKLPPSQPNSRPSTPPPSATAAPTAKSGASMGKAAVPTCADSADSTSRSSGPSAQGMENFADFSAAPPLSMAMVDLTAMDQVLAPIQQRNNSVDFGDDPISDFADFNDHESSSSSQKAMYDAESTDFGDFVSVSSIHVNADQAGTNHMEGCRMRAPEGYSSTGSAHGKGNPSICAPSLSVQPNHEVVTIEASEELQMLDLFDLVLREASSESHVLRAGPVNILRLGGFPKKMVKKQVWMVLTKMGLIIRKDKSADSKVHHIFSLHRPLSLNASDTYAIGLNGMLLCGSSPLERNGESPDNISQPTSPTSRGSHTPHSVQSTNSEGWVRVNGTSRESKFKAKFISEQVEVSFASKEELDVWMDSIFAQSEVLRDI